MNNDHVLRELFLQWSGNLPDECVALPSVGGSARRYVRLQNQSHLAIGAFNPNTYENKAFFAFTAHFQAQGVRVPSIFLIDESQQFYLLEDLGDLTLLDFHLKNGANQSDTYYRQALAQLAFLQTKAAETLDYGVCYPTQQFDEQAITWDLNFFKYYFLNQSGIVFDEAALECDFKQLSHYLSNSPSHFFMFRDFQARNIMIKNNQTYFIDYQGGRKGALQYDVASLLFQAKANLPNETRESLLAFYLEQIQQYTSINITSFRETYYGFVLVRILQTLGTYGLRGLFERKAHFLESLPFALKNAAWWFAEKRTPLELPHLQQCLLSIADMPDFQAKKTTNSCNLTVTIGSFSYKKGIPEDQNGNGGGFVFDCRAISNPGRLEVYKNLTGRDQPVIDFFHEKTEMKRFLQNAFAVVEQSVENYCSRGFEKLTVQFGCTGGQHRSVFAADSLYKHLQKKYSINLILSHREQTHLSETF